MIRESIQGAFPPGKHQSWISNMFNLLCNDPPSDKTLLLLGFYPRQRAFLAPTLGQIASKTLFLLDSSSFQFNSINLTKVLRLRHSRVHLSLPFGFYSCLYKGQRPDLLLSSVRIHVDRLSVKENVPLVTATFPSYCCLNFNIYLYRHQNHVVFSKYIMIQEQYQQQHRIIFHDPSSVKMNNMRMVTSNEMRGMRKDALFPNWWQQFLRVLRQLIFYNSIQNLQLRINQLDFQVHFFGFPGHGA
jgi:hypothetical protein